VATVVCISGTDLGTGDAVARRRKVNGLTTDHYRRLLTELKLRPPSQRAFLKGILRRAINGSTPTGFPAVTHAVLDPVGPS
jgi:hypothetical protein